LRLANRGSERADVAIAEIAEVSLANYGNRPGISMFRPKSAGILLLRAANAVFLPSQKRRMRAILLTITPYLCAE
jgi:hypothetical protein